MMTRADFHNAIRSLFNIDRDELPGFTDAAWTKFQANPPGFFIRADDETCAAIWAAVAKRQRKPARTAGAPEIMFNALLDIRNARTPDQPADSQAAPETWALQHAGALKSIAATAIDAAREAGAP